MYIHVKVRAGAKKELLETLSAGRFAVSVREKAERNMANERVREIVARQYGVPVGKIRLISGHHSPSKIFSVDIDK